MLLYLLDLIGCFAFAYYGARQGIASNFNSFGIYICAFLTALGGGTIREVILGNQPVYFQNYTYLYVVIIAAPITVFLVRMPRRGLQAVMQIADAVGLSAFAFIGASRAYDFGLGLPMMILFAVLTAVGGGILTDILTRRLPVACLEDFHIAPALMMALLYYLCLPVMHKPAVSLFLLVGVFLLRVTYIYKKPLLRQAKKTFTFRRPSHLSEDPLG